MRLVVVTATLSAAAPFLPLRCGGNFTQNPYTTPDYQMSDSVEMGLGAHTSNSFHSYEL